MCHLQTEATGMLCDFLTPEQNANDTPYRLYSHHYHYKINAKPVQLYSETAHVNARPSNFTLKEVAAPCNQGRWKETLLQPRPHLNSKVVTVKIEFSDVCG